MYFWKITKDNNQQIFTLSVVKLFGRYLYALLRNNLISTAI